MSKKILTKTGSINPLISILYRIYPLLLICTLGIIIYSNSFDCSFNFDDIHNIVKNEAIRDINDVKAIWDFYFINTRFVGIFSFALNYHFHQLDVFGYHVVNLLIHIGASFFVWWLIIIILSTPVMKKEKISRHKRLIALWCGLLFISHPVQTQAVTYIVQRLASLSTMFYLASLCLYVKARLQKRKIRYVYFTGSAVTALMGMFTKETVFTLPFAIILFELGFFHTGRLKEIIKNRKILLYVVPSLLFALIIPGLLSFDIKRFFGSVVSQRSQDPLITSAIYLMTQFRVIVTYIRLLFLPINQNLDYDFPVSQSFFEPATLLSFLFLVSILFIAIWIFPRRRLIAVGILWFFLTLSVESGFKPIGNVIFEHRLYLPMFGFILFFVSTLYHILWNRHSKAVIIILMTVTGCNSFLTYERNKVWKDDFSLWNDVVKKSPDKVRPHINRAESYKELGEYQKALNDINQAIKLDPDFAESYYFRALYLADKGENELAIMDLNKAIRIKPNYEEFYFQRGLLFESLVEHDKALKDFNQAININPGESKFYSCRAYIHFFKKNYKNAWIDINKAKELGFQTNQNFYNNLKKLSGN